MIGLETDSEHFVWETFRMSLYSHFAEDKTLTEFNPAMYSILLAEPSFTFRACLPAVLLALLTYTVKLFEEAITMILNLENN